VQELGVGAVDPALEDACREAAADAGRARGALRVEPQGAAGEIRGPERGEETGRMKAALVELSRGHAAHPARDLVADRDRRDQVAAREVEHLCQRQGRRDRRAAHVHDRFEVCVVVFERLREGAVRERGMRRAHRVAGAQNRAGPLRRQGHRGIPGGAAERRRRAGERQPDGVEHAQPGGVHHVVGQIIEAQRRRPAGHFVRERHRELYYGAAVRNR
jgi:hypothetical protein